MSEQVDKYIFTYDDKEYKMNAELTMAKNLADLGGISLALKTLDGSSLDIRANLVKNMEEFQDLFNLLKGDNMYIQPNKRVRMW
jgi:predicted metalloendopeptidase